MMKKRFLAACLIGGVATMSTPATAATLINFDVDGLGNPIAANTPITTQYANLGVQFAGFENGGAVNINAAPDPDGDPEPSLPNVLTNCSDAFSFCAGNRADLVQISFASAVSQLSLQLNSLGGSPVTFNLYDSLNNLLETQTISSVSGYTPVTFIASGVSRIDGLQPNDQWAWAMDDLTFESSGAVPEPATWAMMLLGFGGVGFAMRRRRGVRALAQAA